MLKTFMQNVESQTRGLTKPFLCGIIVYVRRGYSEKNRKAVAVLP
jgi:hypothetical protein